MKKLWTITGLITLVIAIVIILVMILVNNHPTSSNSPQTPTLQHYQGQNFSFDYNSSKWKLKEQGEQKTSVMLMPVAEQGTVYIQVSFSVIEKKNDKQVTSEEYAEDYLVLSKLLSENFVVEDWVSYEKDQIKYVRVKMTDSSNNFITTPGAVKEDMVMVANGIYGFNVRYVALGDVFSRYEDDFSAILNSFSIL